MSTFDYTKPRATAERLLARFGGAAAIRRSSTTGGSAHDPSSGTTTTTDHACTLVLLEYTERERDGTLIQARDKKVLLSTEGLTIEPAASDLLVIGDNEYSIVNVDPLRPKPGGTTVMWTVQARS